MKPENISIQNGIEHVFRKCPICGDWGWVKRGDREVCVFCREKTVLTEALSQYIGQEITEELRSEIIETAETVIKDFWETENGRKDTMR